MRKFFTVLAMAAMFLTVSTYASCFQNQTFVNDDSYLYYQVVPKIVKVKTVTKVSTPGPVKIVPTTIFAPLVPVRTFRPTPWTDNYPFYQYPYYQGNCDYRYYYGGCGNLLINVLRLPIYVLDGIFCPLY